MFLEIIKRERDNKLAVVVYVSFTESILDYKIPREIFN